MGMGEDAAPAAAAINFSRDGQNSHERKVDPATYVAAFNPVALPPDMPDYLKAEIELRSERVQRMAQEAGFANSDNDGFLNARSQQERQNERDAEALENVSAAVQQAERERLHEREWLEQSHSHAGQTLTGEEWRAMRNWFGDAENVATWEEAMMAETGASLADVRRTGGKMKQFYDLMDRDARGVLTADERREFEKLQQDEDIRRGLAVQKEIQAAQHNEVGFTARNEAMLDGSREQRLNARSELNADDTASVGGLANVAPVSPVYREAASGSTPQPLQPLKLAVPVAQNTIAISPDNMFG